LLSFPQRLYVAYKALIGRLTFPGGSGGMGWGGFFGTGSKIDFAAEVGPIQNLALVQAGINWVARGLNSARFQVVEVDADSKEKDLPDHPVAKLFHRPNPYYSGSVLMDGLALSWLTFATAYLLIVKNRMGQPAELWWEPHWSIRPRWPQNGSEVISYYEIWRNGRWITLGRGRELDNIEVLVIRKGWNPETRCGWNSMTALLTEFYTDKRAALFMAQLMRTGLVPPIIVALGTKDAPFVDTDGTKLKEFKAALVRKMSGDTASDPMVTAGPAEVQRMGFDYSSIGLKDVRQIPVTRFCGAMGISSISLNLDAGDATHANYNNVQGYLKHDYQSYIVGLQDTIADEVDRVMLPMFGEQPDVKCAWDYTKTPLMQSDKMSETKRTAILWTTQAIDRAEMREANSYKIRTEGPDTDIGVYYAGKPQGVGGNNEPFGNPLSDEAKHWFDWIDANDLDDGMNWWRRNAPREARALARVPAKPNGHAT
jgi:phage portal protein BeeE